MGFVSGYEPLPVAGAVTLNDAVKLIPVDFTIVIRLPGIVPFEILIGDAQVQKLCMHHGFINELLTQLVIGLAFDAPFHALLRIGAVVICWAKHHD